MQARLTFKRIWPCAAAAGALYAFIAMRAALLPVLGIALGGLVIAFLLAPLHSLFQRSMPSGAAALAALIAAGAGLIGLGLLLVPTLTRQLQGISEALPEALERLSAIAARLHAVLSAHGIVLPAASALAPLGERLGRLAQRSLEALQAMAAGLSRLSLMTVLAYFILADRERLGLRTELLVPLRVRGLGVRMADAVKQEMHLYLRAQGLVCAAVGLLSSLALALAGVRSALALGLLAGLFNMIPYLGPIIGAVPALIVALGSGPLAVAWAGLGLFLVQQLDGSVLSPRIMGSLTGLNPAVVLLAVYVGAQLGGVIGMLFALPVLLAVRACVRVYVQSRVGI